MTEQEQANCLRELTSKMVNSDDEPAQILAAVNILQRALEAAGDIPPEAFLALGFLAGASLKKGRE